MNRRGIRRYDAKWRYRIRPTNSVFRTVDQKISGSLVTNRDDEIESGNIFYTPFSLSTQIADEFDIQLVHLHERVNKSFPLVPEFWIPTGNYHFPSAITTIRTSRNRKLRLLLTAGVGGFYNGWGFRVNPVIEWRPNAHWLLSAELDDRNFYDMKGYDRDPAETSDTIRSIDFGLRVARVRVNIAFTPDLSWNTFVQYSDVSDVIGLQSRVHWIIQEGREVFLVLNQDFDTSGGEVRQKSTEPTAKISWTFRF